MNWNNSAVFCGLYINWCPPRPRIHLKTHFAYLLLLIKIILFFSWALSTLDSRFWLFLELKREQTAKLNIHLPALWMLTQFQHDQICKALRHPTHICLDPGPDLLLNLFLILILLLTLTLTSSSKPCIDHCCFPCSHVHSNWQWSCIVFFGILS